MTKDPNMFYPDDPDYPTGGPHAVFKDVFPRPGHSQGNPDYKEGDTPYGVATDAERALYERFTQGPDKDAAKAEIDALLAASGETLAHWLVKASGHQ